MVVPTYLIIILDKEYSQINLATELANSSDPSATEVLFINDKINCSISSGDLSGVNVELRNTGQIQLNRMK